VMEWGEVKAVKVFHKNIFDALILQGAQRKETSTESGL